MKTSNRFNVGSGVYACDLCGRKTRETGGGESDADLCFECFELCGMANAINDGATWDSLVSDAQSMIAELNAKGVAPATINRIHQTVVEWVATKIAAA